MDRPTIYSEQQYDEQYGDRDWKWYQGSLQAMLLQGLKEPVLDLGCGLGIFVECCVRNGIRCSGLDGSSEAVERALKRYPGLSIASHDLNIPLPYNEGEFGTIILNQVIEHLPKHLIPAVLKEMFRVVRRNGNVFIYSPSIYNTKERAKPEHISLLKPTQLRNLLREAGFCNIQSIDSPKPFLGDTRTAKAIMARIFSFWHPDWLSASANCIAVKLDK